MENRNEIRIHGEAAVVLGLFADADWLSPGQIAEKLRGSSYYADYFAVNGVKGEIRWLVGEGLLRAVDFEGRMQVYGLTDEGTLALSALNVMDPL